MKILQIAPEGITIQGYSARQAAGLAHTFMPSLMALQDVDSKPSTIGFSDEVGDTVNAAEEVASLKRR